MFNSTERENKEEQKSETDEDQTEIMNEEEKKPEMDVDISTEQRRGNFLSYFYAIQLSPHLLVVYKIRRCGMITNETTPHSRPTIYVTMWPLIMSVTHTAYSVYL